MNICEKAGKTFGKSHKILSLIIALISTSYRLTLSHLRLTLFLRRGRVIQIFSERYVTSKPKETKVLVVITHIVQPWEAKNEESGALKIERLRQTIDGLLSSLSHCDLKIIINTLPNRNVITFLPSYIKEKITVRDAKVEDSMFAEYYAQDLLIENKNKFDWFLFIEDDLVIMDSYFLEKIAFFNDHFQVNDILIPNRYEMCDGVKHYIDIVFDSSNNPVFAWNILSTIDVGGVKFSECANPHGGMYCLNREQLQKWVESGRHWHNKVLSHGPLEWAATFCLFECFNLYKPHSENMHFLEVLHYDVKYSKAGHSLPIV